MGDGGDRRKKKGHADVPCWWLPLIAAGLVTAVQGLRLRRAWLRATRLAAGAAPVEQHPARVAVRVLLVGDSTGLGVGAAAAGETLAGLLAADYPSAQVTNLCRCGDTLGDMPEQLRSAELDAVARNGSGPISPPFFDLVLLLAGGNDVFRHTPPDTLRRSAAALMHLLRRTGRHVIWLGPANIGHAPVFLPPVSWWFAWRSRKAVHTFAAAAQQHGVDFIDFCWDRAEDLFAARPDRYFANDQVHPSGSAYRVCYDMLRRRPHLGQAMLGAANRQAR